MSSEFLKHVTLSLPVVSSRGLDCQNSVSSNIVKGLLKEMFDSLVNHHVRRTDKRDLGGNAFVPALNPFIPNNIRGSTSFTMT